MITEKELTDKFSQVNNVMKLSSFQNWIYDNQSEFTSEELDLVDIAVEGKKVELTEKLLSELTI